jgi:hypothetical protein
MRTYFTITQLVVYLAAVDRGGSDNPFEHEKC